MRLVLLGCLLVACGGAPPPAPVHDTAPAPASPSRPTGFDDDLALFRASRGKPWNPQQEPAMEACARIFHNITFVGRTKADVVALLGQPDGVTGNVWSYMRHNGEIGCSHTLTVLGNVVTDVREHLTQ